MVDQDLLSCFFHPTAYIDSRISNPAEIYGWSVGLFNIGGIFNVGIAKDSPNNLEPSGPRPFEGMWRISLKDTDFQ